MRLKIALLLFCLAGGPAVALASDDVECGCRAVAVDCCREIRRECLSLTVKAHCPPAHQCVTPLVPRDCREERSTCHMPVEPCLPCGEPRQRCDCHKPATPVDLEACGCELEPELTGSLELVKPDCECEAP